MIKLKELKTAKCFVIASDNYLFVRQSSVTFIDEMRDPHWSSHMF